MTMWTEMRMMKYEVRWLEIVDSYLGLLKVHFTKRYGISDTTGLTPFVVVVGSNNFLPVSVCLLTRSESCKKQF